MIMISNLIIIVECTLHSVKKRKNSISLPAASKDLHIPSTESMFSLKNWRAVPGLKHRLAPPTMAASHSPLFIAWTASYKAIAPEEQAVSSKKLGPGIKIKLYQLDYKLTTIEYFEVFYY